MPHCQAHDELAAIVAQNAPGSMWERARLAIFRSIGAVLAESGSGPQDIGLSLSSGEHPAKRGMPGLRLSMGCRNSATVVYFDWHGRMSWRRTRRWLKSRTRRHLSQKRWIVSMEKKGTAPDLAPLTDRNADLLLQPWIDDGSLTLDMLDVGRPTWIRKDGLPEMKVEVDQDRVCLRRMRLSRHIDYVGDDGSHRITLGPTRIPDTLALALRGAPLDRLLDSPHLVRQAIPVIERVAYRRGRPASVILRQDRDGRLDFHER